MAGQQVGQVPLKCSARTHALWEDGRLVRVRCTDRKCPDYQRAKARGMKAIHVFDTHTYIPKLGTYLSWVDEEPAESRRGQE